MVGIPHIVYLLLRVPLQFEGRTAFYKHFKSHLLLGHPCLWQRYHLSKRVAIHHYLFDIPRQLLCCFSQLNREEHNYQLRTKGGT